MCLGWKIVEHESNDWLVCCDHLRIIWYIFSTIYTPKPLSTKRNCRIVLQFQLASVSFKCQRRRGICVPNQNHRWIFSLTVVSRSRIISIPANNSRMIFARNFGHITEQENKHRIEQAMQFYQHVLHTWTIFSHSSILINRYETN